jgi:NAD(P)-dependent dehydrogenase (short-subunit alcohol dehydrogenase family)
MSAPLLEKMSEGEISNLPSEMIPLKRIGDEKEMMGTFLYLASRAGGYTNGAVIVIDGGRLGNFPSTF